MTDNSPSNVVVVVGKESVGKSQLISSITGRAAVSGNFRGTTVSCETYHCAEHAFVDTPGILRRSDSAASQLALAQLRDNELVLLVAQATHLDEDLAELLPLVHGKRGAIAVTYRDKLPEGPQTARTLQSLGEEIGVPMTPVDARRLAPPERAQLLGTLAAPGTFTSARIDRRAGWRIEPRRTPLEVPILGRVLATLLLLAPAIAAVWLANDFAGRVDPLAQQALAPAVDAVGAWPSPLAEILSGRYGLLSMGPLMFVWAIPTVVLYAFFFALYKTSGLIDRINVAMDPLVRPFGLAGRDLVRVMMGFGCNVPAVINTRACSSCTRGTCISTIAFGAACSYQLGATLAVFGAAGRSWLITPYLVILTLTTLIYARLSAPRQARSRLDVLVGAEDRNFLQRPRGAALAREMGVMLRHFFQRAIPIFLAITIVASLLDWLGAFDHASRALAPVMAGFHLPADSALPVLMAAVRKDGILLFAEPGLRASLSAAQLLTGVYLAGVLLPCLVTVMTIVREQSGRFMLRLVARQVVAATLFAIAIGWAGYLIERLAGSTEAPVLTARGAAGQTAPARPPLDHPAGARARPARS